MERKIQVAPSLLSCDFGRMAEDVASVERAGADMAPYVAALYRTLLSQSRAYQSKLREKGEA